MRAQYSQTYLITFSPEERASRVEPTLLLSSALITSANQRRASSFYFPPSRMYEFGLCAPTYARSSLTGKRLHLRRVRSTA